MTVASDISTTLLNTLTSGKNIVVPNPDVTGGNFAQPDATGYLYTPVDKLEYTDLTTGVVGGGGMFDKIMMSLVAHLKEEFKANRISGSEYTKAYQAMVAQALQTATSFLMSQDQAYWQVVLAQKQAQTAAIQQAQARVELETARAVHARSKYEAETAAAQYAAAQLQIALLDAQHTVAVKQAEGLGIENQTKTYQLANILPAELAQTTAQTGLINTQKSGVEAETAARIYTTANILPLEVTKATVQNAHIVAQTDLVTQQKAVAQAQAIGVGYDNAGKLYNNEQILPQQKLGLERDNTIKQYQVTDLLPAQKSLVLSQTSNADSDKQLKDYQRTDILPAQKALYTEQKDSYVKDAKIKSAKMWTDVFITLKTMDIAITADQFNNANMDSVLTSLRNSVQI